MTTDLRDRPSAGVLGGYCLAATPALALALLLGFAGTAALATGSWPTYVAPDPKDVSPALQVLTLVALATAFPAGLAGGAILLVRGRGRRTAVLAAAAALVGLAVLLVLARGDLGAWLLD